MAKKSSGAWKLFVAMGIILAIMIAIYAYNAYKIQKEREENTYNGFEFYKQNNLWVTSIERNGQPYFIRFHNHPRDTLQVIKDRTARDLILNNTPEHIFISVDPNATSRVIIAGVEIARITGSRYDILNIPTSSALSSPDEGLDVPIVTCQDATEDIVVIQFVHDPAANAVVRDENCIILFYKTPEDSVLVADRLAYMLLQIMY